jgi:hypothetical protein
VLARQLLYSAAMLQVSRKALLGAFAGQRPGFQTTIVNKINYSMLFPLLLLLGNICVPFAMPSREIGNGRSIGRIVSLHCIHHVLNAGEQFPCLHRPLRRAS